MITARLLPSVYLLLALRCVVPALCTSSVAMSDINSSLYDFVYFLACFFFIVWLVRIIWTAKELAILSSATTAHSLALLHDLLALSPRITHELLLSYLKKKSTVSEHDVPQLVLPITLVQATAAPPDLAADTEGVQLRVCARLEGRVECYVGVSRRLLSTLYHNYDLFNERTRPSDKPGKPDRAHVAPQHKQQITPTRSPTTGQQQPSLLYAGESEWSSVQHVPVAQSSTHVFQVPAAIMLRVRADASLLPVVVVVRADRGQAGSAGGVRRVGGESGVELAGVAASRKELRQKRWLASLPASPDSTLVHLTILTSSHPSSPSPASPSSPSSSFAFTLDSQLVIHPSARRVWHMNDVYGLSADDADGSGECLVCMSESKAVLLLPCRHLCVCVECFDSFQQQKCPVCRTPLEEWCVVAEDESDGVVDGAKVMPLVRLKAN